MNDEETVALIAGGHTFGKTHGAGAADDYVGPEPEGAPLEAAGPGLEEPLRQRQGPATRSPAASRSPGRRPPTQWGNRFFEILFGYEWELTESPGRRQAVGGQGRPRRSSRTPDDRRADAQADDAHHRPRAARRPGYEQIVAALPARTPTSSPTAFAKAWYKLLHRDMGPVTPLPRPVGARAAAVAGPGAAGRPRAGRPTPTSPPSRRRCSTPGLTRRRSWSSTAWASAASFRQHRQARRRQRRPDPAGAAAQLGGQRARAARARCCRRSSGSSRSSTSRSPAARRSRSPT